MKKPIFLLLAIGVMFNPIFAQKGLYMSLNGQLNAAYIMNQNNFGFKDLNYSTTIGFGGNLNLGYNFNPEYGLLVNGGITKGGQKYKDEFKNQVTKNIDTHTRSIKLTYANAGILFRYSPILPKQQYVDEPKVKLNFTFGPQIGVLAKADVTYTIAGKEVGYPFGEKIPQANGDTIIYKPISDDRKLYQKIEVSLVLGASIDYLVTEKFFINAGLRIEMGVSDINAKAYRVHDGYDASRLLNPGLQFGLGYFFIRD